MNLGVLICLILGFWCFAAGFILYKRMVKDIDELLDDPFFAFKKDKSNERVIFF